MKKIIFLILFVLAATSSIAFAAQETWSGKTTAEQKLTKKEVRENLLLKRQQINANHLQELQLRKQVKAKVDDLQRHVKMVNKNRTLTPEKLALIKQSLGTVKTDLAALQGTAGGIVPKLAAFKSSLRNRDFVQAEADLDAIISVQQRRIELMQRLLSNLDNLQKSL
ncbi:MAG: hypothetical protein ACOY35_11430 [Bacillota bacterium]